MNASVTQEFSFRNPRGEAAMRGFGLENPDGDPATLNPQTENDEGLTQGEVQALRGIIEKVKKLKDDPTHAHDPDVQRVDLARLEAIASQPELATSQDRLEIKAANDSIKDEAEEQKNEELGKLQQAMGGFMAVAAGFVSRDIVDKLRGFISENSQLMGNALNITNYASLKTQFEYMPLSGGTAQEQSLGAYL